METKRYIPKSGDVLRIKDAGSDRLAVIDSVEEKPTVNPRTGRKGYCLGFDVLPTVADANAHGKELVPAA